MANIEVNVLGVPEVKKDGKVIEFPYKKAEALFYFLCVNKKTTREILSSLLWSGHNEESAKKNLRNAIYIIKNKIDSKIINTPNRSVVELNQNTSISIDIDKVMVWDEKEEDCFCKIFLEGFFLKDAYEFEEWLREQRYYYQKVAIDKLNAYINKSLNNQDYSKAEHYLLKLIKIDSYNEEAYRQLMQIYKEKGQFKKALTYYKKLEKYLYDELGVKPDIITQRIYQSIKVEMELANDDNKDSSFFGRAKELKTMKNRLELFNKENTSQCIVIQGEAGVGKSALIQHFISKNSDENTLILSSYCYQAEEKYCLRPWNTILEQIIKTADKDLLKLSPTKCQILSFFFPNLFTEAKISDGKEMVKINPVKYGQIIEIIFEILRMISKEKKLIFVIDDIQWADNQSIKLVYELLLRSKSIPVFFILSGRNESLDKKLKLIHTLYLNNILEIIELKRLSKEETFDFCRFKLKVYKFDNKLLERIYKETEGNIFFIVEILNLLKEGKNISNISNKMQGIMESRLSTVSDEALQVLNIMSVFFDEVAYSTLQVLSNKKNIKLVKIMEELQDKYLIKEVVDSQGELMYAFTHIKIREYIYSRLSVSRAKFIHSRVASFLENKYSSTAYDDRIVTKLIYHFSKSGNKLKELEYLIKRAKTYLCFGHELFPAIDDNVFVELDNELYNCDGTERQLKNIESLIISVGKTQNSNPAFTNMVSDFFAMKGSVLIQKGNYEEGIRLIDKMIKRAEKEGKIDNLISGLTQMCYYGIQTDNKSVLSENVSKMYNISKENNMTKEYGMSLRFLGVLKLMNGEYIEAENLFNESINIFKSLETLYRRYTFSITAGLNYIGDTRLYSGNNEDAFKFYEKCIDLSEGRRNYMSLSLFYANGGHALFNMSKYELSKEYFTKSLTYLDELKGGWVHSIANSFMALLLAKEGDYVGALHNLKLADKYCDKLKKKYWIAINYRVKAEIKLLMEKNFEMKSYFHDYLTEEPDYYASYAKKLFNSVGNKYGVYLCENICSPKETNL